MGLDIGGGDGGGIPKWMIYALGGGAILAVVTILKGKGGGSTNNGGNLTSSEIVALGSIQQQLLENKGRSDEQTQSILDKLGKGFADFSTLQGSIDQIGLSLQDQMGLLTDLQASIDPITGTLQGFGTQFASLSDMLQDLAKRNPTQYNLIVKKYPKLKGSGTTATGDYKFSFQGWPFFSWDQLLDAIRGTPPGVMPVQALSDVSRHNLDAGNGSGILDAGAGGFGVLDSGRLSTV